MHIISDRCISMCRGISLGVHPQAASAGKFLAPTVLNCAGPSDLEEAGSPIVNFHIETNFHIEIPFLT